MTKEEITPQIRSAAIAQLEFDNLRMLAQTSKAAVTMEVDSSGKQTVRGYSVDNGTTPVFDFIVDRAEETYAERLRTDMVRTIINDYEARLKGSSALNSIEMTSNTPIELVFVGDAAM